MLFTYSLASDLHMDTGHNERLSANRWDDFIIIAGDLGNGLANFKFVEKLKAKGHQLFCIDGNHEHYANARSGRSLEATEARFYEMLDQSQVHQITSGLYLIGCNGWYIVEDEYHWYHYMNDAKYGALTKEIVNAAAVTHARFLSEQLILLPHDAKAIIITHTAPCEETLDPKYEGSPGNPYYVNPLMQNVMEKHRDRIVVWHHGHTHTAMDKIVNGVHVVSNPRGYPGENLGWTPLTMEVSDDGHSAVARQTD